MKKVRKFDAGGMASSSPQPAFTQFGGAPPAFGSGMVGGMGNTADTGVGGVRAAPAPMMAQPPAMTPTAPTQAMRKGGAVKKLANGGKVLGDDETRMARFDQMTPAEQKKLSAEKAAALKDAEGQRKRPLSRRILDKFMTSYPLLNPQNRAEDYSRSINEDNKLRELRYQDAKKDAETLSKPSRHYGVDRVLKLDRKAKGGAVKKFSKGGAVMGRGDGCCTKGGTKGTMR